jgi:hypothetical protein
MKSPSKSIGTSLLRATVPGGRGPERTEVTPMKSGGPSMVASGEGQVVRAPGPMHERSAAVYGSNEVMGRFGGRGVDK